MIRSFFVVKDKLNRMRWNNLKDYFKRIIVFYDCSYN